jgi:uncharacterized delta-60 repeat protein
LQGYLKGKLATATFPNSTLNGFLRFISDDPANTRNAFYAGGTVTRTYDIKMPPAPFVLGYAVDASWATPIIKPVTDPMTDFPPGANCAEPWKIEVSGGDIIEGGQAKLTIDVYDWQGKDTHYMPVVESPELFDGTVTADWKEDGPGYARYEATITNSKNALYGNYMCLVSVEAVENDPVNEPWLDLTAYQVYKQQVSYAKLMWAKRAGGDDHAYGYAIAALSDNSTVVTGWFYGSAVFGEGEANETTLVSAGGFDIFIARYNPDGTLAWAKRAGGTSYDLGIAITALSDNSIVVAGEFRGSATFGPGEANQTTLVSAGGFDIFIARYNPDGSLAWAKRAGGTGDDVGYRIAALSDNSTVVTGLFFDSAVFGEGEANETTLVSAGSWDIFIARYDPDGTLAWAKRAGGTSYDLGYAITALSDNSTVVTGWFYGSAVFGEGEANETTLLSAGEGDVFIAHYNPDGTLAWAKRAGGTFGIEGYAIAALSDNSTVVTGLFYGSAIFGEGEANETTLVSADEEDVFIAHYNPDGTLAWAKRAGGTGDDVGYAIAALSDNSTVVTGAFVGSAIFGEGEANETTLVSAGNRDVFIAHFAP